MHDAYVGPTGCGKTSLAKQKAGAYRRAGVHVLVCDPFLDDWPCSWKTTSLAELIQAAKQSRRCALFIDEGGQTIARDPDVEWLFTGARHWGHKTHALVQDGIQMTPTMRGQCSTVSLFGGCDERVAEVWARSFADLELRKAVHLGRYEFLYKERWKPVRRLTAPPR